MAIDTTRLYKMAVDWQAKSIGDLSVFAGVGGGVKHMAIYSPSLGLGTHAAIVFGGFGAEAKAKIPKIDKLLGDSYEFMKSYIEYSAKGVEGTMKSAGGYEKVTVFRSFSLADFAGGYVAQAEAGAAVVGGAKVEGMTVYSGFGPIFSIPPGFGAAWGLGAGAQASGGLILSNISREIYQAQQFEMEMRRKPTDMFPGFKG